MSKKQNYLMIAIIAFIAGYYAYSFIKPNSRLNNDTTHHEMQNQVVFGQNQGNKTQAQQGLQAISDAFAQHQSHIQVQTSGKVKAVLADDHEGSRHQKFILSLGNGLTVLVAHNIDLAPRIEHLKKAIRLSLMVNMNITQKVESFTGRIVILVVPMKMVG